jgi:hypothetical protein
MTEYKKVGSKTIAGKKAPVSVYKKNGSNKLYVKRNGLMISYVSYKKSFAKKLLGKTLNKVKKPNQKTRRRYTMGGDCANMKGGMYELFNSQYKQPEYVDTPPNSGFNLGQEFVSQVAKASQLPIIAENIKHLADTAVNTLTGNSSSTNGGHMKKYKKKYQRFGGYSGTDSNDFRDQDGGKRHKRTVKNKLKKRVVKK